MQKVLIDYTYYQHGTYHGGGEYGDTVLRRLLGMSGVSFGLVYYEQLPCRRELVEECEKNAWCIHTIRSFQEIPKLLEENGYIRFYSALPYQPDREDVRLPEDVEFVATYHGLREIELMDYIGLRRGEVYGLQDMELLSSSYRSYRAALMMTENRRLIAASEHSKYSLLQYFPILQNEKIEVLYPPMKWSPTVLVNEMEVLKNIGVADGNYALLVSAGTWYKNAVNAVVAYDIIFDMAYSFVPWDFKVIIVGGEDNSHIHEVMRHKEHFILSSFLPTETLEILYKHAQLFVFPSLNEGFGYPPLEAMKYGTICACAADTSITEVCRDMVLYFNPLLIGEIVNRILQSFSEKVRQRLTERMNCLKEIQDRQQRDLERLAHIISYGE